MRAPRTGRTNNHGGRRSRRPTFTYGKLETIASARTTTPVTVTHAFRTGATSGASASTAAAIVVGTPQKNWPFFGETLNRASRIAAQTATSAQAGRSSAFGVESDSQP